MPKHRPPETYAIGQPVRPAPADVYSFALCIYAMWTRLDRLDDKVDKRRPSTAMLMKRICGGARFAREGSIPGYYWVDYEMLGTRPGGETIVRRDSQGVGGEPILGFARD
jgi:hypothetical protein